MRIKTSKKGHVVYRYTGRADGKTVECKIGSLPIGASIDRLPADLLDNLTPREARILADLLQKERATLARAKLLALTSSITDAVDLIDKDTLDNCSAERMSLALSAMTAAVRRVRRLLKGVDVDAQPCV